LLSAPTPEREQIASLNALFRIEEVEGDEEPEEEVAEEDE
jgi:hypothetical protein